MAVIEGKFQTQGTHLYFQDLSGSSDGQVLMVTCPTGIQGLNGGSADRIDATCLSNVSGFREYVGGMADPAEVTVDFILYKGDASHQALTALSKAPRPVVPFLLGLSDSDADATAVDTEGFLVPPGGRTAFGFKAYISNLTFDFSGNEVGRGTMTLQPTGETQVFWDA